MNASNGRLDRWKARARAIERDTHALYLASRDPRVPWLAKLLVALIVAYALSPIDLIPDFVPVLGYLDDLLLIPLGFSLAIKLIPPQVLAEHRAEAARRFADGPPRSMVMAAAVVLSWCVTIALVGIAVRAW